MTSLMLSPDWKVKLTVEEDTVTADLAEVDKGFAGTVEVVRHGGGALAGTGGSFTDFECGARYYVKVSASKAGQYILTWQLTANAGDSLPG